MLATFPCISILIVNVSGAALLSLSVLLMLLSGVVVAVVVVVVVVALRDSTAISSNYNIALAYTITDE